MNSFELNKVLGAILGTCLIVLALNIAAGALFTPEKPAKPGYAIAVKEHGGEKKEAAEKETPLPVRLAHASIDKGKAGVKPCQACHTFEKGGPNRVGPNLWNVVGEARGEGRNGFNFSSAMKAKGGKWTFEELDKFIENPRGYIPGTIMTFAGVKNDQRRADVLAFLNSLSDNPEPLPKPQAEAAPTENKPAGKAAEAPKAGEPPKAGEAPAQQPK